MSAQTRPKVAPMKAVLSSTCQRFSSVKSAKTSPMKMPNHRPGQDAADRDLRPGQSPGDALDPLEVGADDHQLVDGEVRVGEEVDALLRLGVVVVDRERLRELQLER